MRTAKPADEARRTRVVGLLRDAASKKMQRAGTREALRLIRTAYEEASRPSPVISPWPAVTAYRYAHLLLRANPNTAEELEKIDNLFAEASLYKPLGPWPLLYRLAVLHRLERRSMASARFIASQFAICRAEIVKLFHAGDVPTRHLTTLRIHDELTNCLELAS